MLFGVISGTPAGPGFSGFRLWFFEREAGFLAGSWERRKPAPVQDFALGDSLRWGPK